MFAGGVCMITGGECQEQVSTAREVSTVGMWSRCQGAVKLLLVC